MQACFMHLCIPAEIIKQPKNWLKQVWTMLCSSLPFLMRCYCTFIFLWLACQLGCGFPFFSWSAGDEKLKILISVREIGRTAGNTSQNHCKPSSLSKCCSAEWLSSFSRCSRVASGLLASVRKTGGIPQAWDGLVALLSREDATALTSLAAWGWRAVL